MVENISNLFTYQTFDLVTMIIRGKRYKRNPFSIISFNKKQVKFVLFCVEHICHFLTKIEKKALFCDKYMDFEYHQNPIIEKFLLTSSIIFKLIDQK